MFAELHRSDYCSTNCQNITYKSAVITYLRDKGAYTRASDTMENEDAFCTPFLLVVLN